MKNLKLLSKNYFLVILFSLFFGFATNSQEPVDIWEVGEKKTKENTIENCSKKNLHNIYKELYKRFLIPFYIPLLVLIPFLLTLSSKENSNYSKLKTITFLIGIFFITLSETSIKLISAIYFNNIIISLVPFLFLIFLYVIFVKKTNFKPI